MAIRKLDPNQIKVGERHRKDYGDIEALAESIRDLGLLQPIVVDSEFHLIAGARRLKAVQQIEDFGPIHANVVSGWTEAAAIERVQAERDENTCRKEFLPSEAVSITEEFEKRVAAEVKTRSLEAASNGGSKGGRGNKKGGEKNPTPFRGERTRDVVAKSVGMSGRTYEKAKAVVESGNKQAIEQMDRTGKVGPAYNQIKQAEKAKELAEKAEAKKDLVEQPEWKIHSGDSVATLARLAGNEDLARLCFTDPPYNIGIDYGRGEDDDLKADDEYIAFCRDWMSGVFNNLTDDGSFWLLVPDEYAAELCVEAKHIGFHLRSWIKWFEGFGQNCSNNFNRTTRHLFYFVVDPDQFVFHASEVMRLSDRQAKYGDKRANSVGKIENDLWEIPRLTGTAKERIPSFPTQLPIELVDRIVRCASDPGDLVLDPFNGSGTTGAAAIQNRRRYVGIDQSDEYVELARLRLQGVEVK